MLTNLQQTIHSFQSTVRIRRERNGFHGNSKKNLCGGQHDSYGCTGTGWRNRVTNDVSGILRGSGIPLPSEVRNGKQNLISTSRLKRMSPRRTLWKRSRSFVRPSSSRLRVSRFPRHFRSSIASVAQNDQKQAGKPASRPGKEK